MHNHVFRVSPKGEFKTKDGDSYDCKVVMYHDVQNYLAKGWFKSLGDALAIDPADQVEEELDGGEYERSIRNKIKALGGIPAGRSSLKTLEGQLEDLQKAKAEE